MAEPLLLVRDLDLAYGSTTVVHQVSFELFPGEILCLVGESGSGKSTLLKALLGFDPTLQQTAGSLQVLGRLRSDFTHKTWLRYASTHLGLVFQSPGAAFNPIRSYRQQFISTLKSHGCYSADFEKNCLALMAKLNLTDPGILTACPFELSGGMNQRMAIVLCLLLRQEILLGDELSSALDASVQLQLANELRRLRDEEGQAQLIVTHHLGFAAYIADRLAIMQAGRLVEIGKTESLLRTPQHAYTKRLLAAVPRLHQGRTEGRSRDV